MSMSQVTEDQNAGKFDLARILTLIRRRHIQFLIPLFLGWLLVWGASWVLPPRYKSSTLILVEQPTMPKDYVTPNITDDWQDRLHSLTEQILSRTRLLLIIEKLHLYQDGQTTPDKEIAQMRKDIDIELVHDPASDQITSFRISYSAKNGQIAQQVTRELTDLFINENLRQRQEESEGTTKFLVDQLADARTSLAEQEARVRQFQAEHEGELPTQQTTNLQILGGLQQQLQNEEDALTNAKQQQGYLQSLIDQYRSQRVISRTGDSSAAGLVGPTDLQSIDQQLDKLRSQLADLSSRYTDHYPDVLSLKSQIAKMEVMRDRAIAESKAKAASAKATSANVSANDIADPADSGPTLQLQSQLHADQLEVTNRERTIAELNSKINDYQSRLNAQPATEQQLADLTRGYDQSKQNYDDLLKKKEDSEMATSMEQLQEGERLTMIDPPSLPEKPDFPNRLKMCGAGFGAGLALGVLVVAGLEFFDDRLHSDKEIQSLLPVAVIAEVPEIVTSSAVRRGKMRAVLGWTVAALVFITILAGSAFSFVHD
jgi:polysaccharide biosynthesis transport protein